MDHYSDARLSEVESGCQGLALEEVGVVAGLKDVLELVQLPVAEVGAAPALAQVEDEVAFRVVVRVCESIIGYSARTNQQQFNADANQNIEIIECQR